MICSQSVFRYVHVSATNFVHIYKKRGIEDVGQWNIDFLFFSYYLGLKVRMI